MAPGDAGGHYAAEYDQFYRACSSRLVGQMYLLTGDREEARDCVQEALERAWARWRTVGRLADPEAWVRTVARNVSISRWRRARNATLAWRRSGPNLDVSGPDTGERDELVAALRRLSVEQRTALVLHHLCDLDVQAVAAETGASVTTVTSRLSRGRAALLAQLPASLSTEGRPT
jgi:RNA polymerase sigma-70 factor (ECF subfamily)